MDKFLIELIVAIREIKDILNLHTEEIAKLKEALKGSKEKGSEVDERLIQLALEGSKNLYMQRLESKLEKNLKELEIALKELSMKVEKPSDEIEREVAEEHLNRLRKALAE